MNIHRNALRQMIEQNGARFFGVEFVKKDGTVRRLNGHQRIVDGHTGTNPAAHCEQYVTIVLSEKDATGKVQFRNVNLDTISALHIGGKRITIK